jgi:pSer/pThr/pTyr-binding forkhead associated (FHA) protein
MANTIGSVEGGQLPLPRPHREQALQAQLPPDFVPLRLVLLPSRLSVELTRTDILVGRHSSADVRLPLPDVSRRHCRFVYRDGGWQVFDLASLNGIFVNHVKVDEAVLQDQDLIDIGGFRFVVEISAGVLETRSAPNAREDVIQSIADSLPRPILEFGEQQRKAS